MFTLNKEAASEKMSSKSSACIWRPDRQTSTPQSLHTLCVWVAGAHTQ